MNVTETFTHRTMQFTTVQTMVAPRFCIQGKEESGRSCGSSRERKSLEHRADSRGSAAPLDISPLDISRGLGGPSQHTPLPATLTLHYQLDSRFRFSLHLTTR